MKKALSLVIITLLITACGGDTTPKDVYPVKKMRTVLWDVIRANEMAEFYQIRDSSWKGSHKRDSLLDLVCKLHETNRNELNNSLDWYQRHPELFKEVLDTLKANQDTIHYVNASTVPKTAGDTAAKSSSVSTAPLTPQIKLQKPRSH